MDGVGGAGFGLFNGGLSTSAQSRSGNIGSKKFGGINMGNDNNNLIVIGALVLVVVLLVLKK